MRISDWSSDVCSSDLSHVGFDRGRVAERDIGAGVTVIAPAATGIVARTRAGVVVEILKQPAVGAERAVHREAQGDSRFTRCTSTTDDQADQDERHVPEHGTQSSRIARPKLVTRGSTRYDSAVRSPAMIITSAGMPGYRRSEEHTSELQSLMRISYAVFCMKQKRNTNNNIVTK